MIKKRESEIQKEIIDFLKSQPKTFAFRVHTFGVPIGTTGHFRKNHNKGIADILGVKRGKFFAMEVKRSESEKPNPFQQRFLERVDASGGYACVVRSLADAVEAFNEI